MVSGISESIRTSLGAAPRTRRPSRPVRPRRAGPPAPCRGCPGWRRAPGAQVRPRSGAGAPGPARSARRACCRAARATRPPPPGAGRRRGARASGRERRRERLSGVVTRAVGSCSRCRSRTVAEVSPVRRSRVQGMPRSRSGARSAASVSAARARSGVIQRTRSGGAAARRRNRASGSWVSIHSRSGAQPGRVGLARARAGVDQAALAREVGLPDLALEVERRPAPGREPRFEAGTREVTVPAAASRSPAGPPPGRRLRGCAPSRRSPSQYFPSQYPLPRPCRWRACPDGC